MTRIRIALVAAAAAVVTIIALGTGALATGASNKLTKAQVIAAAHSSAARNGEMKPKSVKHVESTRGQAVFEASGGDSVPSDQDVYLVIVHGHFVAADAPRPPGTPAPTGSVMTLVMDATTGDITDFGVSDREPDAAKLGQVSDDE
jgi:co-chaperonin GroES (HSP10)